MNNQKLPWESENPGAVKEAVQGSSLFGGGAPKKEDARVPQDDPPRTQSPALSAAPQEQSTSVVKSAGQSAIAPTNQPTPAQRFTAAIEREFSANNGATIQLTNFQRKIIQSYFIKVDMVLAEAERKRLAKKENYRDPVPVKWENVNMAQLAVSVIAHSAIGLDPAQPNHINPIPFKNNNTDKYEVSFIMGYRGIELKSRKYGLDVPDDVVVELVYSTDTFEVFKKDIDHPVENYRFVINNSFNRGNIVGGFYYHRFTERPEKNKIRVYNNADIEKRKPDKASPEFWGGEKDIWENNKKVGKEQVAGWYDEMAYKTIYRAAYNDITIDSEKIDENFWRIVERESEQYADHALEERNERVADGVGSRTIKTEDVIFEDVTDKPTPTTQAALPAPGIEPPAPDAEPPYAKR